MKDSTGIPHILEHSVLCGSRKYPLKGPFVELLKGSLHTFLNAFTYPDRTCYPVASTNTKDFYNLVDVYVDAVFFPKCVEDIQTFQQEGWHYELNNPSEEITYKGVVFLGSTEASREPASEAFWKRKRRGNVSARRKRFGPRSRPVSGPFRINFRVLFINLSNYRTRFHILHVRIHS
ncbi:hypothetical protein R6Q59_011899 [Mikania micrantha]